MDPSKKLEREPSEAAPFHPAFGLLPDDPYDRRLLANVHPPDWINPKPRSRYHLVVVGGGTAGLVTAAIAAALGARVALIERKLLGGDCLNVGCVPSKALLAAARRRRAVADAAERFGAAPTSGKGDFGRAMERMRRIRAEISGHDSAARFRELGVDVFLGQATFTARDSLAVGDQALRFRRAVIAAGTRAATPPIRGLAEAGYLTNESVFSLTELPPRLVVIGGGPIGCELAQAFARFGSEVTLLEAMDRILLRDDEAGARVVADAMAADGVRVHCGATVFSVERSGKETVVRYRTNGSERTLVVDHVLVAVGRMPNVDGLGLELADVDFDARTGVTTDDRMRTTNPKIFAIGDIATRFPFTHAADAQARMVVRNALFWGRGRASQLVVPWCTYTSPELAHVGIPPEEVARSAGEIETITVALADTDRARLEGVTDGFLRVHLKKGTDTILGATLVAEHAGDLVSQMTQAITAGIGLGRLGAVVFPYPTQAEVIRKAADLWRRQKLTPRVKRGFRLFFRMTG
jgi:pyruvate/2-oxoglutarate dehydrogenase complex dihydrolipoamide dehydrogenase (E3) component